MAITVQSSYVNTVPTGFAGMVVDGEVSNRISRTVEDAAGIAFGIPCYRGAGGHGCTATVAAGKFLGVAIADAGQVPGLGETADTIAQNKTVALLNEGVIFVNSSVAVNQGDQAYQTPAGAITNVATSNVILPAKFDLTISAAGLVPLRVTRS